MTPVIAELLLDEVRLNRQEIKELRKEIWSLKTRFAVIALAMGIAGGKAGQMVSMLL